MTFIFSQRNEIFKEITFFITPNNLIYLMRRKESLLWAFGRNEQ